MKLRFFLLLLACLCATMPCAFAGTSLPAPPEQKPAKVTKLQRWIAKKIAKKIQKRTKKTRRVREDGFWYFLLGLSPVILGIWLIVKVFSFTSGFLAFLTILLGVGLVVVGAILLAQAIDIYRGR